MRYHFFYVIQVLIFIELRLKYEKNVILENFFCTQHSWRKVVYINILSCFGYWYLFQHREFLVINL
jgi:hypothetical protein